MSLERLTRRRDRFPSDGRALCRFRRSSSSYRRHEYDLQRLSSAFKGPNKAANDFWIRKEFTELSSNSVCELSSTAALPAATAACFYAIYDSGSSFCGE